jgi:hypothetical protein
LTSTPLYSIAGKKSARKATAVGLNGFAAVSYSLSLQERAVRNLQASME